MMLGSPGDAGRRPRRLSEVCTPDEPDLNEQIGGWRPEQLTAAIFISGPFDLVSFAPHMHRRGLSTAVMRAIFDPKDKDQDAASPPPIDDPLSPRRLVTDCLATDEDAKMAADGVDGVGGGLRVRTTTDAARAQLPVSSLLNSTEHDEAARRLRACSPLRLLELLPAGVAGSSWISQLPPITLLHGTADKTCPHDQSVRFRAALLATGVEPSQCVLKLYPGKTHTSPIIEDPMSGSDPLNADLINVVHGKPLAADGEESAYSTRALCPAPLIAFASWVGPF